MARLSSTLVRLALALSLAACSSSGSAPGEGVVLPSGERFTRQALLGAIGTCVADETHAFQPAAAALATQAGLLATDAGARPAAQQAWRDAMAVWQHLELMQIGPLAMRSMPGGEELRQAIYAWPAVGPCAIDQALLDKAYTVPSLLTGSIERRGLAALEYLLFHVGPENGCDAANAMNTSGAWAALDPADLDARRRAYAQVLAADVAAQATALVTAWDPAQKNFVDQLRTAGDGSRVYRSQQFALNSISDAIFYLDADTKDMKIARPAGLGACMTATCPEALESRWAGASKAHVAANIDGFRKLFTGCGPANAGIGFDDYLYAVGAAELGTQIDAAAVAARASVDAITESDLAPALAADLDRVRAVHTALRGATDLLKTQFISVLDLEIPRRIEGDND